MAVRSLVCVPRPGRYLLAVAVAAGVAVAGCSSATGPGVAHAKVSLKLQMRDDAGSRGKTLALTCDPAGDQPAAASACSVLLRLKRKNPFAPIAGGQNCPLLLLSNRKILVTGTWFGVKVHRLVVDGGCDMALFDSLRRVLRQAQDPP
jgi:hypothetical protein